MVRDVFNQTLSIYGSGQSSVTEGGQEKPELADVIYEWSVSDYKNIYHVVLLPWQEPQDRIEQEKPMNNMKKIKQCFSKVFF